jgi:3',5'-cyclic-AMP phosphodiesterase
MRTRFIFAAGLLAAALLTIRAAAPSDSFQFVILGDRTGEAQPGVYQQVLREASAANPDFFVGVGDTIQGLNDGTAEGEWREVRRILDPYRRYPLYLAPGNHDIWSATSERLYRQYSGRPLHYSFDYRQAHFTIMDSSRTEELSASELAFAEEDLKAHQAQPLKFIVSHRPTWIVKVALGNPNFRLHQLARQYGVRYVVAGHLHQMLRLDLEGVTYISMPSSGGHLRASGQYGDGWFFGYAFLAVKGMNVDFRIQELIPPYGQGRMTKLADWGLLGLVRKQTGQPEAAR